MDGVIHGFGVNREIRIIIKKDIDLFKIIQNIDYFTGDSIFQYIGMITKKIFCHRTWVILCLWSIGEMDTKQKAHDTPVIGQVMSSMWRVTIHMISMSLLPRTQKFSN